MSKEVRIVFFDFDGVLALEDHGCVAISRALAKQYDLPYEEFALLNNH